MKHMIVGIDEVGRGCWAGPLVAAAVLLTTDVPGLRDSKKLSKSRRESLAAAIRASGAAIGVGWVTPAEVDALGLSQAVRAAMLRALKSINSPYEEVIVDGNINFLAQVPCARALVRADDLIPAVSAASIIAKVARDQYMSTLPKEYEGYGFASHVGYGTAAHLASLKSLGVSDLHRRSFKPIKALLELA